MFLTYLTTHGKIVGLAPQKIYLVGIETYRIDGGAPAGISIRPGDDGCRTTKTSIKMITMHGKRRTAPRGMEMEELPFNRIRRLRSASLGDIRYFCRDRSSREGKVGEEGIRFRRFLTIPIGASPGKSFGSAPELPRAGVSRQVRNPILKPKAQGVSTE